MHASLRASAAATVEDDPGAQGQAGVDHLAQERLRLEAGVAGEPPFRPGRALAVNHVREGQAVGPPQAPGLERPQAVAHREARRQRFAGYPPKLIAAPRQGGFIPCGNETKEELALTKAMSRDHGLRVSEDGNEVVAIRTDGAPDEGRGLDQLVDYIQLLIQAPAGNAELIKWALRWCTVFKSRLGRTFRLLKNKGSEIDFHHARHRFGKTGLRRFARP